MLEIAGVTKERCYISWMSHHAVLEKDKQRVRDIESSAVKSGSDQHSKDIAAFARLVESLEKLKTSSTSLVVTVCAMRGESVDPFEAGDMRGCYANLVHHYRKGDEMCVTTTIIGGIKLTQQQSQSLKAFFRLAGEEFMQRLLRMNIKSISVSELAAMIVIGGMNKKNQEDFLKSNSQLTLTLESIGDDVEGNFSSGSSVVSRRGPQSMFDKLRAYVKVDSELDMISTRLKGVSGLMETSGGASAAGSLSLKEAKKRALEAQQVLVAVEASASGEKAVCIQFQQTGRCGFGSKCKYLHPKKTSKPTGGNVCYAFRDTGVCSFGDACRFAASHVDKETPAKAKAPQSAAVGTNTKKPAAPLPPSKPRVKAASAVFAAQQLEQQYAGGVSDDDEGVGSVRVKSGGMKGDSEQCLSAGSVSSSGKAAVLCWDTGSSIHVVNDRSLLDRGGSPVQHARD
eukprot:gene44304-55096_t